MTGVHIHKGLYTVIGHAMRYAVCCIRQAPQNLYTSPPTSLLSSWFCLNPSTGSLKVCISQRNRRTRSTLPRTTRTDIWLVNNSVKTAKETSIILHKRWSSRVFRVDVLNIRSEYADRISTGKFAYFEGSVCVCRSQWPRCLQPLPCAGSNPVGAIDDCLLWMCVVR